LVQAFGSGVALPDSRSLSLHQKRGLLAEDQQEGKSAGLGSLA